MCAPIHKPVIPSEARNPSSIDPQERFLTPQTPFGMTPWCMTGRKNVGAPTFQSELGALECGSLLPLLRCEHWYANVWLGGTVVSAKAAASRRTPNVGTPTSPYGIDPPRHGESHERLPEEGKSCEASEDGCASFEGPSPRRVVIRNWRGGDPGGNVAPRCRRPEGHPREAPDRREPQRRHHGRNFWRSPPATAWVRGIIAKQADVEMEVTGPPKAVAYDNVGAPTRAAVSFAEKQGVALHELHLVTTPKGESIAARITKRGRTAHELLLEILPRVIHDLPWPKTMTWTGLKGARFIRPIRWIVALLDGKPLKFSFGGVTAGDTTSGHRFLGQPATQGPPRTFRRLREEAARKWRHRPARRAPRKNLERTRRACQTLRLPRPRRRKPARTRDLPQ